MDVPGFDLWMGSIGMSIENKEQNA
jgi:hypothetical protein